MGERGTRSAASNPGFWPFGGAQGYLNLKAYKGFALRPDDGGLCRIFGQSDYEIGRIIDALDKSGQLDNTLVIYLKGDNGARHDVRNDQRGLRSVRARVSRVSCLDDGPVRQRSIPRLPENDTDVYDQRFWSTARGCGPCLTVPCAPVRYYASFKTRF
jgi:hypothetical protein